MTHDELCSWMTRHRWTTRALSRALDLNPSTLHRYRTGTLPIPRVVTLALQGLQDG